MMMFDRLNGLARHEFCRDPNPRDGQSAVGRRIGGSFVVEANARAGRRQRQERGPTPWDPNTGILVQLSDKAITRPRMGAGDSAADLA